MSGLPNKDSVKPWTRCRIGNGKTPMPLGNVRFPEAAPRPPLMKPQPAGVNYCRRVSLVLLSIGVIVALARHRDSLSRSPGWGPPQEGRPSGLAGNCSLLRHQYGRLFVLAILCRTAHFRGRLRHGHTLLLKGVRGENSLDSSRCSVRVVSSRPYTSRVDQRSTRSGSNVGSQI